MLWMVLWLLGGEGTESWGESSEEGRRELSHSPQQQDFQPQKLSRIDD